MTYQLEALTTNLLETYAHGEQGHLLYSLR